MRGKDRTEQPRRPSPGITPACAGKRLLPSSGDTRGWDHPRVCGEKMNQSSSHRWVTGSPPRMRGKVSGQKLWMVLCGITPACAGKSGNYSTAGSSGEDHPRVCGEKFCCFLPLDRVSGSPPRMRGKAGGLFLCTFLLGITPAYAGKSPLPPCRPVSPARFSGSGRHGPTLHPGRGCSHCPHKRRC